MPILPISHQSKQSQADSGTAKIKVNPTQVRDLLCHPVAFILWIRIPCFGYVIHHCPTPNLPSVHHRRVHFDAPLRVEHGPSPGVAPLVVLEDLHSLDDGVQSGAATDLMRQKLILKFW